MAKVTIYSRSWCPYCKQAISLLESQGIDYNTIDIDITIMRT